MGKTKQKSLRHGRRAHHHEEDALPNSAFELSISSPTKPSFQEGQEDEAGAGDHHCNECPSKFALYQISVQSPKGDISYLQKFFFAYIGGRSPAHLREDFCGTALICSEWLKGGTQRVATGLDLDLEALTWGLQNNFNKVGGSSCGRLHLLHGNVLQPLSMAQHVSSAVNMPSNGGHQEAISTPVVLTEHPSSAVNMPSNGGHQEAISTPVVLTEHVSSAVNMPSNGGHQEAVSTAAVLTHQGLGFSSAACGENEAGRNLTVEEAAMEKQPDSGPCKETASVGSANFESLWPSVDIICAFNYSCCCLHKRADLIVYFKHALHALSGKGGIFAMDLYGGVSSEAPLKLRRHFPNFTYVWEQEAFDVVNRMTKISLHFQPKNMKMLRHAFTYHWRLWSLPEVRDCLEEVGFDAVHVWVRDMPALEEREDNEDTWNSMSKYEERKAFHQQSAWNAYVVAVSHPRKANLVRPDERIM